MRERNKKFIYYFFILRKNFEDGNRVIGNVYFGNFFKEILIFVFIFLLRIIDFMFNKLI